MREVYSKNDKPDQQKPKATKAKSVPVMKNMSVSVSQIENGYLVHHSGEHKGKYVSKTTYSPENPLQIKPSKLKFGK